MISLADIRFHYHPDEPIIEGLTHAFLPGTSTALTGLSGSGKSTLLYLLGLLLSPEAGTIHINEEDTSRWSDPRRSRWRATEVGFVFQDAALDPTRPVLDNVVETSVYNRLPRRKATLRAEELMDRFGVSLRASHKPGEVSGGQAQRVALCRALLSDPALILADEPTGNLDTSSARVVLDALFSAAGEGKTVVIATHDNSIVKQCDEVVSL